jgi:uncharacterized RDD family membrane protein YckC
MAALAANPVAPARIRQVVTPEGVALDLEVATLPERLAAFAIDAVILAGSFFALVILWSTVAFEHAWLRAAIRIAIFLLANGYFLWFELRWAGRTPGKRAVGIRVVSRSGGPLRAGSVFARNLMRDVELFLPLKMLFAREEFEAMFSPAAWWLGCAWLLAVTLVPWFNRDRLRVGDVVGGTMVVRSPTASLLRDLARRRKSRKAGAAQSASPAAAPAHAFTPAQLEIYGIYELQALEDVLRNRTDQASALRKAVAARIGRKIGHPGGEGPGADLFLADFYAALRAHLERKMLFGKRKEKKDR